MYYKNRGSARIILAGGSLLGLLIVVAIIASLASKSADTSVKAKQQAEKQVDQIQKALDAHGRTIDRMTEGSFDVILEDVGGRKNAVIEAVCLLKQIDSREAKNLIESTPATIMTDLTKIEAENAKRQLEQAGAAVKIDKSRD
ncbi:MAG: ribosomal protein L7/L12 [Planctomycetota bacterium]|nr:ribosomal protein L7/L12 [Planctomycetota bacterium]